MPHFFRQHRDGTLTIMLCDGSGKQRPVIGPIPADLHAHTLRDALDKLERMLAAPRPKQLGTGHVSRLRNPANSPGHRLRRGLKK